MVARIGLSATTSREPRQARKGAAAAAMSGAGGKAGAGRLPLRRGGGYFTKVRVGANPSKE